VSRQPESLLIADDLTGACDGAAPFALRGCRTRVFLTGSGEAEVQAYSTDSRDAPPAEIRERIAALAACLPARGARAVFKKIDSTLRGRGDIEIAAALEAFRCDAAVITPALPSLGRIVEAGMLRVLHDPDFLPVSVAEWLRAPCASIRPETLAAAVASGARLISVDAACDEDLDRIAAEILALDRRILWAGSAGLASALARTFPARTTDPEPAITPGPVLFAIGSNHPATLAQQNALLAARPTQPVLRLPRGRVAPEHVRQEIAAVHPAALFLSGGDTAAFVCRALGVEAIDLHGEILPGVPRGTLRGGDLDGLPVVTKSGGFGGARALIEVADYFACPRH
jgi:D-threonate/D-erythronate kinase